MLRLFSFREKNVENVGIPCEHLEYKKAFGIFVLKLIECLNCKEFILI